MTQPTPEDRTVLPFAAFLQAHRRGAAAEDLSEALQAVVQAAQEHGKPATLTLKITVKTAAGGALEVTDDLATKLPTAPRGASLFYADDDGNLCREDPRQTRLPLAGPTGVVDTDKAQEA